MKLALKLGILLLVLPVALAAQPGVRMSADFLPLEVGNRWVYDVFNEGGQKIGAIDFLVQDRRIVDGRSFYAVNNFPFVADGSEPAKLIRYDIATGSRTLIRRATQADNFFRLLDWR